MQGSDPLMARFKAELPNDIIKEVDKLEKNTHKMLGEMTKAGAETVLNQVQGTAPAGLGKYAKLTRVYDTPSDGAVNTKVYFSGYLPFKPPRTKFSRGNGGRKNQVYTTTKGIPADFLANVFEYGRSTSPFPKKPFFRKAFNKRRIESAMLKVQEKYIK